MGHSPTSSVTQTTSSLARFPLLSSSQYNLLNRIISRLPPRADTFDALFESYNAVLAEQGIEVAEENVCYGVLLKLGMERGATWTERWRNVVAGVEERGVQLGQAPDHGERRGGHLDILRQQLDKLTLDVPPSSSAASTRARRPASAPPPLDSPSTPRRNFLVKTSQLASSSDDNSAATPSPSRTRTRSRYTVAPGESSSSSLRPSRVYSDSATHATPPPRSRRLYSATPVAAAPPELPMVDTLAVIRENAATAFRNLSLVGRQFNTWRVRTHTVYEQEYQVDRSRDNYVLRLSLHRWRRKLSLVGELESRLAAYEDGKRRSDVGKIFKGWMRRFTERKKAEWESALRSAAEDVVRIASTRLLSDSLDRWRRKTQESRAISFHRRRVQTSVISQWIKRYHQVVDLATSVEAETERKEHETKAIVFDAWSNRARELTVERELVMEWSGEKLRECWGIWVERTRMRQLADDLRDRITSKSALKHWRSRLRTVQDLDRTCDALVHSRNQRLLAGSLDRWITEYSGALLLQSREAQIARTTLGRWIERFDRITIDLDAQATAFAARSARVILANSLSSWITKYDQNSVLLDQAAIYHDTCVTVRTLGRWRDALKSRRLDAERAEVAHAFFVQRRLWNTWYLRLSHNRQRRWIAARDKKLLRSAFGRWTDETRRANMDQIAVEEMQSVINTRMLGDALSKWTSRVVDLRSRAMEVQAHYDQKLLRSLFVKWTDQCIQHGDDLSLVESFRDVKEEELHRKVFRHWLYATRKNLELSRKLERKLAEDNRATLEALWEKWRDRFGESALLEQELAVVERRNTGSKRRVLNSLINRSLILPAIQFDTVHTRRRVFATWRDQVPKQVLVSQATEWDTLKTLGHTFLIWHMKTRSRSAVRAASRFRALATSALPARSSPSPSTTRTRTPAPPSIPSIPSIAITPNLARRGSEESPSTTRKSLRESLGRPSIRQSPSPGLESEFSERSIRSGSTSLEQSPLRARGGSGESVREGIRSRLALAALARK